MHDAALLDIAQAAVLTQQLIVDDAFHLVVVKQYAARSRNPALVRRMHQLHELIHTQADDRRVYTQHFAYGSRSFHQAAGAVYAPVAQPGQFLRFQQLVLYLHHFAVVAVALYRHRSHAVQIGGDADLSFSRGPAVLVVIGDGTDQCAIRYKNRHGPAGLETVAQRQLLIVAP